MEYYLTPVAEVAAALHTAPTGLDAPTAARLLAEHGPNQLADTKQKTWWRLLLHQFTDVMILVLLAAAVISALVGETQSAYVILAIIILNAVIGFVQEYRADKAMAALQQLAPPQAQVLRAGQPQAVPAAALVPGDVLLLEAGNIIPADVRFFETHALKVDESSLTGESANVQKNPDPLPPGDYPLGDRLNLGYKGTSVTSGRATAYVVATGMGTELGKIAALLQTAETPTPLQQRLGTFGKWLAAGAGGICLVFFAAGWWRGEPLGNLLLVSISLAVAAIPEALPAVVTIALALGAKRLAKDHALIRKLPAVETLGSVTYICTDKTGTLTLNEMTTQEVYADPAFSLPALENTDALLTAMALNTDASQGPDNQWLGDSTEVALARYAADHAYPRPALEARFPRLAELPFDAERKCMSTLHQTSQGVLLLTKGAPGVLFAQLAADQKAQLPDLEKRADAQASQGYRVLAYAAKMLPAMPGKLDPATLETDLAFIGFASLIDPAREEARQAVADCQAAGIIPVMITGDHKLTAQAIARKLGILGGPDELVLTGPELTALAEPAFAAIVEQVRVYARVDPAQKLRIISALQAKGQFVAMTGDGVNDAPALKHADIGVAMGIGGTEVAKEAAHMILLDDDFATIVLAVRHGRRIYDNILKFIRYILSGNVGEIWAIFLAPFFGLPIPLLAIQILWINLLTDGLPGLALAYEPAEANTMQRPPRPPNQSIFADGLGWFIGWVGLLVGALTLGTQAWAIRDGDAHWQTMTFTVLCFTQLGSALAIRSSRESLFTLGLFSNKPMLGAVALSVALQLLIIYLPFLNKIFTTSPLSWSELGLTVAISSIAFWAIELQKLISRRRAGS
ncbi:cation-translocating P-type ATPase [Hymenobacter sp. UV11]|uniref:cation-translocating P-type ATPase n=1 Tax=Hymenobacter sp. UV11 TaxID=1849735 RepID=UPI00105F7AD8|nr:cation-translocating P-type ATPase [Hymenobacter sp. UV11]TDN38806.1 ATPase [Hymenobacter sp. UV11]TFZ63797.1 cation-translocating P-type ATPase [Hymenobacter sp. UV11]